jgi:hypothetical protein
MAIVATLMAGVIDTGYYCMDDKGQVFRYDPQERKAFAPVSEPLATRVREAIERDGAERRF